ncbi:PQQ-dependent sugar dehydrogenase [Nonomuraea africana]|uniref:Glucose/arabinose dehydrogenase n=1 Tax=Nonomuraea africana TaxID=46171 RepID=A0ABR9KA00_9ACTN|nr:PQQ-dependent sugar dehydrogenase [Nonomuraea africana]MBE1558553.1 glucose/arabinose dehydrogenase [Nonomuraea africana]
MRLALPTAVLVTALTACSAAPPAAVTPVQATPSSTPSVTASAMPRASAGAGEGLPAKLRFTQIAQFDKPVAFAVRKGDDAVYIAEQGGRLHAVKGARTTMIVDLSAEVSKGNEQGLLGVAFHPSGKWLYLDWTDAEGTTHVTEWAFDGTTAKQRRDVLTQDQPYANHNGGQLAFGPDGYLYIGLGDGGGGGDPQGNGQKLTTWLGKILRIDPRGEPYVVPEDNPFKDTRGARPEIWAYGLRNPWRFSFDKETGDLWIGDVGQDSWEEVDHEPRGRGGRNYGWNAFEGDRPFDQGVEAEAAVEPVITYQLGEGGSCSVIAGYVYRGTKIPGLRGHFLYGDFCAGWIRAAPVDDPARTVEVGKVEQLSSFGQGNDSELYALSLQGPVYRVDAP